MKFTESAYVDFFKAIQRDLKPINSFFQMDSTEQILASWRQSTFKSPALVIDSLYYTAEGVVKGNMRRKYKAAFAYAEIVDINNQAAVDECKDRLQIYIKETIAHIRLNSGDTDQLFHEIDDSFSVNTTPPLNNKKMLGATCEFTFWVTENYFKDSTLWL